MQQEIERIDFCYENSPVKIVANRNCQEIRLAGLIVGPFDEGNEYEVYYWVAKELAQAGMVHFREEDTLDPTKLFKIQWKEGVQVPGQISELPPDFYPKLRRFIAQAKEEMAKQPEKHQDYEKAKQLARDIVNSRLKKIVALSSASAQEQVLKKLTVEEKLIYEQLRKQITDWKANILELENNR